MAKKVKKGFKTMTNVMTLGATNKVSKMLNPDIPQPPDAPEAAPVADDALTSIASQREMARRRKGGRGSTILSESNKLG